VKSKNTKSLTSETTLSKHGLERLHPQIEAELNHLAMTIYSFEMMLSEWDLRKFGGEDFQQSIC
jgi:hypothetical protein